MAFGRKTLKIVQCIVFFVQITCNSIASYMKGDGCMGKNTTDISIRMDSQLKKQAKRTVMAMLEAERIAEDSSIKGYTDEEELLADLKK